MRLRLFLCLAFILALATTLPPPAQAAEDQDYFSVGDKGTLAEADAALAKAYKQAVDRTPDATALKAEQRRWVKDVRDHCQDGKCLREAYQTRLRDLQ